MRSAAATFGDDIGAASAPSRKPARKTARKPRAGAARGKGGGPFRLDRVARVAAIAMTVTIGGGILVNALMMQKGHHPAPLFAKEEAPAPVVAEPPAPPVAQPAAEAPPPPAAAKAKRAAAHDAPKAQDDDPIGQLLKGAPAPAAADKGDKSVLGVQKALAKLGFAVKLNGTMGASTRKAIEAYEKGHNLPVKGEVSRRLVKALAADSGVRIE